MNRAHVTELQHPDNGLIDIYQPKYAVSLDLTLTPLMLGSGDPTFTVTGGGFWRTVHTPHGSATIRIERVKRSDGPAFQIHTWGAGAEWARASVPDLLGARDDWSGLDLTQYPPLAEVRRRLAGLRLTRTNLVSQALIAAIFGQKTTGRQARESWRKLVMQHGAPAPGPAPAGLRVTPTMTDWGAIPSWDWHRAGVEPARARVIITAANVAASVDGLIRYDTGDEHIRAALQSIPGVGPWTIAETVQRSHGDPDTISVGDYQLAKDVGWALIGKPVDDAGMLDLLERWRGHRQRIVRLIGASGYRRPRHGARITTQDHRWH